MKYRRYRGRSLFQDKWVYGAYLKEGSRHYIISEVNKNLTAKCIVVYSKSVNEFVMNFNGEDLFEGDILVNKYSGDYGIIEYNDDYEKYFIRMKRSLINYSIDCLNDCINSKDYFEKIGNKWDNPELFKE